METLLSEQTLDERTLGPQNPFAEPTRDPQDHIIHWLATVDNRDAPDNAAIEPSNTESPSTNHHAMRLGNNSVNVTLPSEQARQPLRTAEGAWDASSDSDSDESSEAGFEQGYKQAHPMQGKEIEETLHPLDAHPKTGEAIGNIGSNDDSLRSVADSTEAPRVPWQSRRRRSAPGKLAGGKQQLSLKGQHEVNGTTFFRSEKALQDDPFVTVQSPPNQNDLASCAVSDSSDSDEEEETSAYTTHRVAIFKAMAELEKEKELLRRETAAKLRALDKEVKALAFELRRIPPYF